MRHDHKNREFYKGASGLRESTRANGSASPEPPPVREVRNGGSSIGFVVILVIALVVFFI